MRNRSRILYGVLNWGLGHATRSIPIIKRLLAEDFEVIIASDGLALSLLKSQFPKLSYLELPALNITYGQRKGVLRALTWQLPTLAKWHRKERKRVATYVASENITAIISDNRPAVFSASIPSVYITHQLQISAGKLSRAASLLHEKIYNKYTSIWVPDVAELPGLSGNLGHPKRHNPRVAYIGPQSDLIDKKAATGQNIGIILSGPEPQRTALEHKLIQQLYAEKDVRLIRGTLTEPSVTIPESWKVKNLGTRADVHDLYSQCGVLISRCGYSTLMDLAHYPKPALLLPTPGQPEQEYLAGMQVHKLKYVIQEQDYLNAKIGIELAKSRFKAQTLQPNAVDWATLLSLFKGK